MANQSQNFSFFVVNGLDQNFNQTVNHYEVVDLIETSYLFHEGNLNAFHTFLEATDYNVIDADLESAYYLYLITHSEVADLNSKIAPALQFANRYVTHSELLGELALRLDQVIDDMVGKLDLQNAQVVVQFLLKVAQAGTNYLQIAANFYRGFLNHFIFESPLTLADLTRFNHAVLANSPFGNELRKQLIDTKNLKPLYGIWKRTCQCGHQLPTTFLNGRNKLTAKCPKCKYDLQTKEATPICIPIVGGPSVGKTCFLFAAIHELVEEIAPKKFWEIRFLDQYNENIYQKMAKDFKAGILPTKTTTGIPVAFNFLVSHPQWSPEKLLYFYDAAGESFQESDILATHQFYNYFHGIIFLIDPFSIPELVLDYQTRLTAQKTAIRPSDMRLEDAFETMILNLEKNFNVNRRQRIKQPCAIVINKVDVFDLEERIGEKAATELMKKATSILNSEDAIDKICREFLIACGLEHFVRKVHHKFERYQFFSSSALGHLPDGTAFHFHKTSKPVMWLLKNIDNELI